MTNIVDFVHISDNILNTYPEDYQPEMCLDKGENSYSVYWHGRTTLATIETVHGMSMIHISKRKHMDDEPKLITTMPLTCKEDAEKAAEKLFDVSMGW